MPKDFPKVVWKMSMEEYSLMSIIFVMGTHSKVGPRWGRGILEYTSLLCYSVCKVWAISSDWKGLFWTSVLEVVR